MTKIEKLVIAGLELVPYKYEETFDDENTLMITARVELTESQEERLRKFPTYFPVIRKGIDDKPLNMRFGQLIWSKAEGKYRMQLRLVDKAYDENNPKSMSFEEPRATNVARSAALTRIRFSALLNKLTAKGVLSEEEAHAIEFVDEERLRGELRLRDQVDNLDEWVGEV